MLKTIRSTLYRARIWICAIATAFVALDALPAEWDAEKIAAMTTHHGDYRGLGDANAAILAWCRAQGRVRAGPSWEVYGHWQVDPAQLRTDVYYLLQPAGATARP